jgi:hypothetical protein
MNHIESGQSLPKHGGPMKYLFWRGNSLWCRFAIPGLPYRFPLEIHTTGTITDKKRCERDGEEKLAVLRYKATTGTLFEKKPEKAPIYSPKLWRLIARFWFFNLRFMKSGRKDRSYLKRILREFGSRYAKNITREDVSMWRQELIAEGLEVNSVNHCFALLKRAYIWSNKESKEFFRVNYNPCEGLKNLSGGKIRTFLLTEEKFERNYALFCNGMERKPGTKKKHAPVLLLSPSPRFALFYLALWESGRRPEEVSQYCWETINEIPIDGKLIRFFSVPPQIAKTDEYDNVVISDRLWREISGLGYRHGLVFRNEDGERWTNWKRHQQKLHAAFGEDGGWVRDCRRGFVTHATEVLHVDPRHVRMQSGHRTMEIFDRYRIGQLANQASIFDRKSTNLAQLGRSYEKIA